MASNAPGICANVANAEVNLASQGVIVNSTVLGVDEDVDDVSNFTCLLDNVKDLYGDIVPGGGRLSRCPSFPFFYRNKHSDWGRAISIVANKHPWIAGCQRMIIPVANAAPHCGGNCRMSGKDKKTTDRAIEEAVRNNVTISPVLLKMAMYDHCTALLADNMATRTESRWTPDFIRSEYSDFGPQLEAMIAAKCCVDPPQPQSLIGWWPLDRVHYSDNNFMSDLIRGRPGFFINPAFSNSAVPIPGRVRRGLLFDGRDDNVVVDSITNDPLNFGTGSFTLDAWVALTVSKPETTLISKEHPALPFHGYRFFLQNRRPALTLTNTGGQPYTVSAATSIPANTSWHLLMVAVNRVSNEVTFFINGQSAGTYQIPSNMGNINNSGPTLIGGPVLATPNPSGPSLNGRIDEVEFFNSALVTADACTLTQAGQRGKCKKNTNCDNFCPSNLIPNGNFECGEGAACPQSLSGGDGLGGLFGWTHTASGCQDVPAWVGETTHGLDCNYDSGRNSKNWATQAALGFRFAWLDVDYDLMCVPIRKECLATQLFAPLQSGYKYQLYYAGIGKRKFFCSNHQARLGFKIAGEDVLCGYFNERPCNIIGQKNEWGHSDTNFTATTAMADPLNPRRLEFVVQAQRGRGIVLDGVCLRLVGAPVIAYSFDTGGGPAGLVIDPIAGLNGTIVGNPKLVPGQISNAYYFHRQPDAITVQDNPALNFGTDSFSIGLWIYPYDALNSSYTPLVNKISNTGNGYELYLSYDRLALRLGGNGIVRNFIATQAVPRIATRRWAYVAAAVDRSFTSGDGAITLYVNGEAVEFQSLAGFNESVSIPAPLRIAQGNDPISGTSAYFSGLMDDFFLHSTVLTSSELQGLGAAKEAGLGTEYVVPFLGGAYCSNNNSDIKIRPHICNYTDVKQTYNYTASGVLASLDPEDDCSVDGPKQFTPPRGTIAVDANSCAEIPMVVQRPASLTPAERGCYDLKVTNVDTGDTLPTDTQSLGMSAPWCSTSRNSNNLERLPYGSSVSLSTQVINQSSSPITLNYEVRATSLGGEDNTKISLNNQAMGTVVTNSVTIGAGQSTMITTHAKPREFLRGSAQLVTVWMDLNGDSVLEPVDSTPLLTTIGDCNNNSQQDDVEIFAGTTPDCNNNLVPDFCDIGAISVDVNLNNVPDECDI